MARTIKSDVKRATDRCMDYLQGKGIDVSRPSVLYTGGYCDINREFCGMARGEIEKMQQVMDRVVERSYIPTVRDMYAAMGIELSAEALDDNWRVMSERSRKLYGAEKIVQYNRDLSANIVIFKALADLAKESKLPRDEAMSRIVMHEMWHHVQVERGLLASPVAEGEAEAARTFFERDNGYKNELYGGVREQDKVKAAIGDMTYKLLYENGLRIVRRHSRSVKTMHNPEVRRKTEQDFQEFLTATMRDETSRSQPTQEEATVGANIFPEFATLDDPITREGYLNALKRIGYGKFLEELQEADLDPVIERARKRIEAVKAIQ